MPKTCCSSLRNIFRTLRAESQSNIDYFTVTVAELQMQVGPLPMTLPLSPPLWHLPNFNYIHPT